MCLVWETVRFSSKVYTPKEYFCEMKAGPNDEILTDLQHSSSGNGKNYSK